MRVCPCVSVCVFDVRPAFFGALCFHGVCCCFCCFSLLLLLLQCPWAHICMFYCICSQFRPPPSTPATPPMPPCAMRVPMFLILYIDIWPPGCQKREPLPKVDCGSLSEARSVGGAATREGGEGGGGGGCPLPLTGPGSPSPSPSLAAILLLKYA